MCFCFKIEDKMKKLYLVLFLLFPLLVQAQTFRLDTIPVAPDDPRNINRHRQLQPQQRTVDVNLQPIGENHVIENRATETEEQPDVQPVAPVQQHQRQSIKMENLPPFEFDRSRLRLGAHLGVSLGGDATAFALGPQVGYLFSDLLLVGTGVKYHHIRVNRDNYRARNNLLGFNVFSYFYPTDLFTIFVRPEINRMWRNVTIDGTRYSEQGTVPVFLIGAGVHFGRFTHITLNYDLVGHTHSPYSKRVFLSISGFF